MDQFVQIRRKGNFMEYFDRLLQQHRYILDLAKTLGTEGDKSSRQKTLDRLENEFELHCFLQESCIYPVLERYESSRTRAEVLWESHRGIRSELLELRQAARREGAFGIEGSWGIQVGGLIEALETHFSDEQTHVFADLRRLVSEEALIELERQIEYADQQQRGKRAA
ncbi:MAG TPA: hypothetical protein DCS07_02805 [Bdellovibrionales bacterium]|nr:MAG: hypothetical protein A2Z97_06730 [Bdellovibrionales bacterium GWB1_52_6]OFZ05496.1 MAG: hypothetical protein A2X97_11510 [Bdellovibrionales bacterium GWA1_52_35]OFZ36301.1 MAG: hypothetical protein A2070_13020 [Bdellovibrionales bacterium GWC1_52_8]HAR41552.1 hypothetical protein [Bdellovibrionales bacterium]HCM39139.1 hypothetical protein [Bdellovibrionales bacterium]